MAVTRAERKSEHLQYALELEQEMKTGFDDVLFVHQSLPNCSLEQIDISTKMGELYMSSPFFINAMTGGGGDKTFEINQKLAIVARETELSIGVGSQMAALKDRAELRTFKIVRQENKNGLVFANLGSEASVEQARAAVDMLEANALQIHLNSIQELTMPEGDRSFIGALSRIEKIMQAVSVPVIVKEVGYGMSRETVTQLTSIGVKCVDVGGFGGTNFSKIENKRRKEQLSYFDSWGIPTAISIVEARHSCQRVSIIGSGGIQTSLDVVKALALGANATGIAGSFLRILVHDGVDALIQEIHKMKKEIRLIMTALGAKDIQTLQQSPLILSGFVHHWLTQREIPTSNYSQRNSL